MIRLLAFVLAGAWFILPTATALFGQEEETALVEAAKQESWTLGDQQWDFKDVATLYQPVKGTLNPKTGVAQWTLELVKELSGGEIGTQEGVEGSPLKITLLDEEKVALADEPQVKLASKLTGRAGDKLKISVQLPKEEVLQAVRHIRIERRTKIGF